jgi:TatD DNase family protein
MLIDSHCHLTYPGLIEDLAGVLSRAATAGVARMITVGTDIEDHRRVLFLLASHKQVFGAIGIHPHHAAKVEEGYEAFVENNFRKNPRLLAVGECGLDYHYDFAPKPLQRGVFVSQLEIARRLNLPVILHVREAHADALAVMADFPELKFVVHCFTGTPAECEKWLALGAYVGITGIVTYKNAADVQASAKLVPADKLLIETDAPYLSPEPVRKEKTNQPANVAHTAAYLAQLRGVAIEELAKSTTQNAAALFGDRLLH